jgi:transposase InsO family protein
MIRQMPFKLPPILSIVVVVFKDRADLVAENMALRQQLSCFIDRRHRPRLRPVDRVFWVLLSRFWDGWRESLAVVKPATVLAWHRKGFRLFWRWKSRKRGPGRPRIPVEVRRLIIEMAEMNVGWGAPRIHGELLKLGLEVSEITVSRYMPKRPPSAGSRQRWATFMRNHLGETLAIDFAVVPTATFGILYVFFVLSLERRRVLHFNVTHHPTAKWTAQQVVEACAFDLPGRFLIRDNDKIYGTEFRDRVDGLGLEQIRTAFRSPWQNGFAERWIASLRRDCLDHVIAINDRQLRRVIRSYVDYYHADRTHLGLEKDTPGERTVESRENGKVVAIPRVGGLHHRYSRELRRAA